MREYDQLTQDVSQYYGQQIDLLARLLSPELENVENDTDNRKRTEVKSTPELLARLLSSKIVISN